MSESSLSWTVEQLEAEFPAIPWREAIPIQSTAANRAKGLACRVCIARKGFHAREISQLPQTPEEFAAHWKQEHEAKAAGAA